MVCTAAVRAAPASGFATKVRKGPPLPPIVEACIGISDARRQPALGKRRGPGAQPLPPCAPPPGAPSCGARGARILHGRCSASGASPASSAANGRCRRRRPLPTTQVQRQQAVRPAGLRTRTVTKALSDVNLVVGGAFCGSWEQRGSDRSTAAACREAQQQQQQPSPFWSSGASGRSTCWTCATSCPAAWQEGCRAHSSTGYWAAWLHLHGSARRSRPAAEPALPLAPPPQAPPSLPWPWAALCSCPSTAPPWPRRACPPRTARPTLLPATRAPRRRPLCWCVRHLHATCSCAAGPCAGLRTRIL